LRRRRPPGRELAFEELVSVHLDPLYRTALRLCAGHTQDAEDLLQDVMLRAFAKRRQLREPVAARSWLFTILVRTNLNRLRRRRRRPEQLSTDMDENAFERALAEWTSGPTPDEALGREELRERLMASLDGMPPGTRAALWLVDAEGFTQREAGTMLGVPEGTIASRVFRGRRALRDALREASSQRRWRMN
jgi:RNA polymerase sigma-70 factor (ECF subfamily)